MSALIVARDSVILTIFFGSRAIFSQMLDVDAVYFTFIDGVGSWSVT
jgi:hypothetical protein